MSRSAYPTSSIGPNKTYDDFSQRMDFGMHRGKTIEEIIEEAPGWLGWAIREGVIKVSNMIENEVIIKLKEISYEKNKKQSRA